MAPMDPGGAVLTFRSGPAVGLVALLGLLAALATTVGLGVSGWVVGLSAGVVTNGLVARGLARAGHEALGPANLVTLTRATLACGVAALVADSFLRQPATATIVALTAVALLLDAFDGWVARRTRSTSLFGACFDGEVDAFLILVLSVYVARSFGVWVLAIGAARYLFAVAGWALAWMRARLPARYWRKVVAATQGVVLAAAAADVVSRPVTYAAIAVALALLMEAFGRDVWWLWRHRAAEAVVTGMVAGLPAGVPDNAQEAPPNHRRARHRRPRRRVPYVSANVLALLLVWFALVAPNQAYRLTPGAFLRIPVEGLVVAGLTLVLPTRARRVAAALAGVLLAVLTVLKLLDMGFFVAFDRPFDLVTDRGYLGPAVTLARETLGAPGATVAVVGAVVLVIAVLVLMPLSVGRLTRLIARKRARSLRAVTGLLVVWLVLAVSGLHVGGGQPIASASAGRLAVGHLRAIADDAREQRQFDAAVRSDRLRQPAQGGLLAGLRGKDVLLVFVESYGRVAINGLPSSPKIRALLDAGTRRLGAAGYSSSSAFLTSSTFGGLSWLAHGTLQSGVWVDNQQRYERLINGNRFTLTRAFGRAGWRTVALLPSGTKRWPEGRSFYRLDRIYGRWDVGYKGPRFGFAKMPDQFALRAFQRLELARPNRAPVMAEIDLASSHEPWAKVPRMIPWSRLGDGRVFNRMAEEVEIPVRELWDDQDDVKAAYAKSLAYSMRTLISFVDKYGDDNLVLILLGDHQPGTMVTGHGASRDVPITIVAHDPAVMTRISRWGWQEGMRPGPKAPVWRMDAFRDRFLDAFSDPQPATSQRVSAARP